MNDDTISELAHQSALHDTVRQAVLASRHMMMSHIPDDINEHDKSVILSFIDALMPALKKNAEIGFDALFRQMSEHSSGDL